MTQNALIVGAGSGNSASFARALARQGAKVALAARNIEKLEQLASDIDGIAIACDATDAEQVAALFVQLDQSMGTPDVVLYNASAYTAGPVAELDPDAVHQSLMQTAFGAFLVAQQAAKRMQRAGSGAIFFTGATASVKGFPNFASFAMGKFALRGLTQSLARELGPANIHIAHFIIDGGIASPGRDLAQESPTTNTDDAMLEPDAIAETYLAVLNQHRSAWSLEVELRPWKETF
ncbi:MAG: SDR family NAD(P)-dependent oxidoreductase [Gammaproteobacteria bacterium]